MDCLLNLCARSPLAVLLSWPLLTRAAEPKVHLFLDPAFLKESEHTALRVNPPQSSQIVIHPDKPWESMMITFYTTVFEDDGKIRLWYICRDKENHPNVAYAESTDGVNFTKPSLGIVEYEGSKDNNLVGLTALEGTVYKDPHAANPEERYVYMVPIWTSGFTRFTSPDGLHWRRDAAPILKYGADNQMNCFWDTNLNKYSLYFRAWTRRADKKLYRRVMHTTLDDLTTPLPLEPNEKSLYLWGKDKTPLLNNDEFPTVLATDEKDLPDTDVYTISAQPYPDDPAWYVGFPSFFQHEGHVSKGRLESNFVGSRDGEKWERYEREPYIAPGVVGSESENMVFVGPGIIERGDEFWQYGTGLRSKHGDKTRAERPADGSVFRWVQRRDGFLSLDFDLSGGRAVTAPVKVIGPSLLVNVDTGAMGALRVGLRASDGTALEGFSADECDLIRINSTHALVTWQGKGELVALQGREVQVELKGTRGKLYSFRFAAPVP